MGVAMLIDCGSILHTTPQSHETCVTAYLRSEINYHIGELCEMRQRLRKEIRSSWRNAGR